MGAERPSPPTGWPFFAPSRADAIAEALDLADVGPGSHLVDLGCGEGRVLVAAARRGARVTGVESDPDLAATARSSLADAGLAARGEVVVADLFDPTVWRGLLASEPVLFAYLSPAVLQQLTPLLRRLARGRALVTVDFDVPDLVADRRAASARLYRLPGRWRRAAPGRVGWPAAGTMCVTPPELLSLTTLEAAGDGTRLDVCVSGDLAAHVVALAGADRVARGRPVAVDLRWHERPAGTLASGELRLGSLPPHPVVVLFAADDQGQWDLSPHGVRNLTSFLAQAPDPPPTTTAELLDAAEG